MSQERAEHPLSDMQGDRLLDFLERARALFHGKWFILLTCTVAASLLLSFISLIPQLSAADPSWYIVGVNAVSLLFALIDLLTMVALIRRTDEGTLNARRKFAKFMFVLAAIGCALTALTVLMMLATSAYTATQTEPLTLALIAPLLAQLILTLDYRNALNGFYKNLYGATQGLYVKRAYAKRAGYEYVAMAVLSAVTPYLLASATPALGSLSLAAPAWDAETIVSLALLVLNAAFAFLFFREAEPVERLA